MSFSECEQARPKVNARLYSPYLGRFVSPDPLLNSEGGAWDYNPYVYANNNPYKYIDRNGEFGLFAIFAAFNAIWNTVHNIKILFMVVGMESFWEDWVLWLVPWVDGPVPLLPL